MKVEKVNRNSALMELVIANGRVSVVDGARTVFRVSSQEYRLGPAMDLLARVNSLKTRSGTLLYSLFMDGEFSLLATRQNLLYHSCLQPFLQFRELFDWLHAQGWPRLIPGPGLPGELARALRLSGVIPDVRAESAGMRLFRVAARLAIPQAWAISARLRGSRIAIYTSDLVSDRNFRCDFRFAKIYSWASRRGHPVSEIFHSVDPRLSIRNAAKRRRIPLHLEHWGDENPRPLALPDLDLSGLEPSLAEYLRRALPSILAKCLGGSERIRGLSRALRLAGIRMLIAMDDYRSNNELLIACRRTGVRAVMGQHGLLTRFHPSLVPASLPETAMAAPDCFLVRGPFWKAVLESYAPRLARVAEVVAGLDAPAEDAPPARPASGSSIRVLFLAETLWDPDEAAAFLRRMEADSRLEVFFKIRPDLDEGMQLRPYYGSTRPHAVVGDLAGYRDLVDVVVGSHSSLLYKLLEWKKPVFRLDTSFAYGEQLNLFGLADVLGLEQDAYFRFKEALDRPSETYAARLDAYRGAGSFPDYADSLDRELKTALGPAAAS